MGLINHHGHFEEEAINVSMVIGSLFLLRVYKETGVEPRTD
jgi:hypothetical protein